jgi:hypothetical protein
MEHVPRVYYKPRIAKSEIVDNAGKLVLEFGHGVITFWLRFPSEREALIECSWDVRNLPRMCLQLPLTVWRGGIVSLDGTVLEPDECQTFSLIGALDVSTPFGDKIGLSLSEGVAARVHYPIPTGVFHIGSEKHRKSDPVKNPYDILLVSCQWSSPERFGKCAFKLRCL